MSKLISKHSRSAVFASIHVIIDRQQQSKSPSCMAWYTVVVCPVHDSYSHVNNCHALVDDAEDDSPYCACCCLSTAHKLQLCLSEPTVPPQVASFPLGGSCALAYLQPQQQSCNQAAGNLGPHVHQTITCQCMQAVSCSVAARGVASDLSVLSVGMMLMTTRWW